MEKKFDPALFDPRVLAESLERGAALAFENSLLAVDLTTRITYAPHFELKQGRRITDRHIPEEHPFFYQLSDFAPFYMRLRTYLEHWIQRIKADIIELRIYSNQFDDIYVAKAEIADWMHNGGPPLVN